MSQLRLESTDLENDENDIQVWEFHALLPQCVTSSFLLVCYLMSEIHSAFQKIRRVGYRRKCGREAESIQSERGAHGIQGKLMSNILRVIPTFLINLLCMSSMQDRCTSRNGPIDKWGTFYNTCVGRAALVSDGLLS